MAELALTRSRDDRRRFDLYGIGSIRKRRWIGWGKVELITSDGVILRADRPGHRTNADAVDAKGRIVGDYRKELLSWAGRVGWRSKVYDLTHDRLGSRRYTLAREGKVLLHVRLRLAYRRTPAYVAAEDPEMDPGLVLFVVWVLQTLNSEIHGGGGG